MTPNLIKNIPEGKQFRLVKYFALASFIVLVIFSFPFSVFISQKAKDILIESYKNYALLLGENLNHQVFVYFSLPVVTKYGRVKLREEEQQNLMDQVIRDATHGFNIDVVNVYTANGIIGYSTDSRLFGKEPKKTQGFEEAMKGEKSSIVLSDEDDLWGLEIAKLEGRKVIRTYIPFHPPGTDFLIGVFEIVQDITEQYKSITTFQYYVFGLSILIMSLIFLTLLFIVHKAEQIIRHRTKEQQELEAQLHLSERLASIGEMVAGISHEIKNPLGIIQSTAELLGQLPNTDDKKKRLTNVITEETSRLNEKIMEFLDFARPQALNLQECRLEEIIKKNISFLGPELEKKHIRIENNLNGRSFKILADQELLYRAFLNIFINAIQAMVGDGTISVHISKEKDVYLIEIKDTGSGIPDKALKKIFNPFFTTKQKGSGLGLSIVKKTIEDHQGTLRIESKVNEGTLVSIQLPRRPQGSFSY
ncbi:MAG: GHKL domain-containing protein [Deltaproteobacteria bacterium]|nr:GHKL domain-containing protein [Deltaproteobacteria bacterium]